MDGECAFCGRAETAARQVFCEDCQAQHRVCNPCADEAAAEAEVYRLVA
jgi:hypothetical protein